MGIVKLRASAHSTLLRAFEIVYDAIVMAEALRGDEGLFTGNPVSLEGIKD